MKAFAITINGNEISENGYEKLVESSKSVGNDFEIEKFSAFTQYDEIHSFMKANGFKWTYPWEGEIFDFKAGLRLRAYPTRHQIKRIGCFCSHAKLWQECANGTETFLILEHDSIFIKRLDFEIPGDVKTLIGINDPRGATRLSSTFYALVNNGKLELQDVPKIDDPSVPQGLAGNSAYIITPSAAKDVIMKARELGAWPNDALICYQNFSFLRVTKTFYTKVQGLPSTTTG